MCVVILALFPYAFQYEGHEIIPERTEAAIGSYNNRLSGKAFSRTYVNSKHPVSEHIDSF